ncbi:MAG: hypothetical protein IPN46_20060 [Saprospiraceae bacterium]|nr:hypothetical protein [Saprospiraceae bacterium]
MQTVIGSNDSIVEVLSFDAWGQRRFADGKPMQVGVLDTFTNDRGFTGHEHLDFFDPINMNGRIYDAILGRFTSPTRLYKNLSIYNHTTGMPMSLIIRWHLQIQADIGE